MKGKLRFQTVAAITFCTFVVFCLFSFPAPSSGAGIGAGVQEKALSNGLKVLLMENHKAPIVTFQVWYRVGSRNEARGKTGLSHMLEHMMFKGTEKVGPEEFSKIIQENGGNDNAFTSHDYTAYFTNISAGRLDIPLELELDRMANLRLRVEDFRTEQMVVMEERRLRTEDSPQAILMEQVEAAAYQIQPYHWPIIGWMEDIRNFTVEDLKAYHRTYYSPANAFLVVVGDFRTDNVLPVIEKRFGALEKGRAPDVRSEREEPQVGERRVFVKKEAQLPSIVMAYHVPNLNHPDGYVLELVEAILSNGTSSRLHQSLVREKRLCLAVDADYSLVSKDPGLFYLSAELLPGKEVSEVEAALDEEMGKLQEDFVKPEELQKAKNQLLASFVYGQDSLFYQAMLLAQHEIVSSWRKVDDYVPFISKVSSADIMRVARQYFVADNRTVGVLMPIPAPEGRSPSTGLPGKERLTR
jgi:zinc protease